jgi:hypothetical protein
MFEFEFLSINGGNLTHRYRSTLYVAELQDQYLRRQAAIVEILVLIHPGSNSVNDQFPTADSPSVHLPP